MGDFVGIEIQLLRMNLKIVIWPVLNLYTASQYPLSWMCGQLPPPPSIHVTSYISHWVSFLLSPPVSFPLSLNLCLPSAYLPLLLPICTVYLCLSLSILVSLSVCLFFFIVLSPTVPPFSLYVSLCLFLHLSLGLFPSQLIFLCLCNSPCCISSSLLSPFVILSLSSPLFVFPQPGPTCHNYHNKSASHWIYKKKL